VRIVVGHDGGVKHLHVIRASAAQRAGIETALRQWRFKPAAIDGRASEVKTGLLIEFRGESVAYLTADAR